MIRSLNIPLYQQESIDVASYTRLAIDKMKKSIETNDLEFHVHEDKKELFDETHEIYNNADILADLKNFKSVMVLKINNKIHVLIDENFFKENPVTAAMLLFYNVLMILRDDNIISDTLTERDIIDLANEIALYH